MYMYVIHYKRKFNTCIIYMKKPYLVGPDKLLRSLDSAVSSLLALISREYQGLISREYAQLV